LNNFDKTLCKVANRVEGLCVVIIFLNY